MNIISVTIAQWNAVYIILNFSASCVSIYFLRLAHIDLDPISGMY